MQSFDRDCQKLFVIQQKQVSCSYVDQNVGGKNRGQKNVVPKTDIF